MGWYCGVKSIGGTGWRGRSREKRGEQRENEEEKEGQKLSERVPRGGRFIGPGVGFPRPSPWPGTAKLVDAEPRTAAHVEDELRATCALSVNLAEFVPCSILIEWDRTKWTKPSSHAAKATTAKEAVEQLLWRDFLLEDRATSTPGSGEATTESAKR